MKRVIALIVAYTFLLASVSWAAEEIRPLGMASATGGYSGDIRVGNTCVTSPLGKYYCGLNTRHIYFFSDNTVDVDHLYPLASADTGFPYVSGGTWTIDSLSTYRGRLGTGTKDNTTYLRGDGTWAVPPDTAGTATTTLPWDNITSTPTTLGGYGITDYGVPTALPWDNITRTLSAGVTDAELSYVDNVTSAIQTQINAKQAYDADLVVLSGPTAWRIFYSNGTSQITELPLGTDNQCLQSTGVYAAPEWGSCGTGTGDYNAAAVVITGGTIDNTVIGGTTPNNITASLLTSHGVGTFSSGAVVVDDSVFYFGTSSPFGCSYNSTTYQMICATNNGVSSGDTYPMYAFRAGVSTALDNGQEVFAVQDNTTSLWKITKEGNVTQTGTLTASQFMSDCSSSDNTCYMNASNLGDPTGPTDGDCYYNTTTNAWLCYNGSTWAASTATSIDWDNIENKHVLPQTKDFVIKGYAAGDNNILLWKADQAQTLVQMDCITGGSDNVTITLLECSSSGASCGTTGLVVAATSTGVADSTPTDASVAANAWMRIWVESIVGTPTHVACSVRYTVSMP